jgi:hypothetical protein
MTFDLEVDVVDNDNSTGNEASYTMTFSGKLVWGVVSDNYDGD